jgi:hydroxymethylpyrimidine/phosphomethylpyrimidine kinase
MSAGHSRRDPGSIPVPRYPVAATHGAGCTHSAAFAAGLTLPGAARQVAAVAGDAVAHGLRGSAQVKGPSTSCTSGLR